MEFKLYNTLTRKKETFKEIKKGRVGMYTCGPTVYSYQHIGNMRSYIFSDLLKRALLFNGYKVKHIINVTDVGHLTSDGDEGEDKMEKAALKEGKNARDIANFYFKIFKDDLKKLNIIGADKWPKASEHIKEQIDLVLKLEKKGYTYKTNDGIYFESSKFKNYSKLGRINLEGLKKGKRVAFGLKKNKTDFALWKFSESGGKRQQEWESPWGKGFPGWHLECSAMSMKYLGEHFDIHTGGEDHVQIHHTNEIAQSECATGKKYVNYWVHGAFLTFKGEKVSKSKGGLYTISQLEEKDYSALDFRYLCLLSHYRSQLSFSLENLESAKNALSRMKRKIIEIKRLPKISFRDQQSLIAKSDDAAERRSIKPDLAIKKENEKGRDLTKTYEEEFLKAINDDLNTPIIMQLIWKMLDDKDFDSYKKLELLYKFNKVLGLNLNDVKEENETIPEDIKKLADERENLRKEKKWIEADKVREKIREKGYSIEDSAEGMRLGKI